MALYVRERAEYERVMTAAVVKFRLAEAAAMAEFQRVTLAACAEFHLAAAAAWADAFGLPPE